MLQLKLSLKEQLNPKVLTEEPCVVYEVDFDEGFLADPNRDESKDPELIHSLNLLVGKIQNRWGHHRMWCDCCD